MKNKYIKRITFLASLLCGATGAFAQDREDPCEGLQGPAEGYFSWSEDDNQSAANGMLMALTQKNKDNIVIYACGNPVIVDFSDVVMTEPTVEWFLTDDYSGDPVKTGNVPTFSHEEYGTYYVRYTNECYAYATVSIIDASIQVKTADKGLVTLCEYGTYEIKVDIDCKIPERLTYWWYKDGTPYINSKQSLSFSPIQKTNEGAYSIVYSTEACVVTQPIVELKVKEYVKFDISGYEMYNGKKSCFVTSGDNVEIPLEYTVPSNSADINELKLSISDNASANKGSMETDNSTFYVTGVNEDHLVRIEAEGKNYCSSSIEFQILRDAKLKLDVSLSKDVLCLGESAELIIDTTGTGRFLHEEDYSLSVVSVTESGVETSDTGLVVEDGMIKKTISPTENTTYRVLFDYRGQSVEMEVVAKVFNLKVETKDTVICEGDAIELQYTASPAGTQVEWFNEDNVPLGTNPGIVVPEGQWTKGATKYTYTYWARPFSDLVICPSSSEMIPLHVEVDRPLEGYIKDQEICEGESVRIDASSYGATTYTWTVNGETIKDVSVYKDKPNETTLYQVNMTRGACEAKGYAEVIVYPNPVIEFIDSMDFRDIMIEIDNISNSNYPYTFIIDDTIRTEDSYIKGLSFSKHTFKVEDAKGCVSKTYEYRVLNPNLPPEMSWMVPPIEGDEDSVESILANDPDAIINVYTITGALVKSNIKRSEALNGLANGAYVVGGVKVIVNK